MNLKEKRLNKELTQAQLAEKVNLTESAICLYENHKRTPSVEIAKRIAKVLGFKWTEFFE